MAWKFADRTAESTVTVGTGDIMLAGAIDTDHDTFGNQFADADTMPVVVFGGGKWMTFEGRYNSGANSITRINFRDSSSGSPIALSGTMTVMCAWGAADAAAAVASAAVATSTAAAALRTDTTQSFSDSEKNRAQKNLGVPAAMRGHIAGLNMSAAGSSASFSIGAGVAVDSINVDVLTLGSAYTKTNGAWAVGSGNGSLDTGTIANGTWYHVHLIKRVDIGVVDILTSTNASSPTLPTNYTLARRIGSVKTDGTGNWVKFTQRGDFFLWDTLSAEVGNNNPGTGAVSRTLNVPPSIRVIAVSNYTLVNLSGSNGSLLFVSSLDQVDQAPGAPNVSVPAAGNFAGVVATSGGQLQVQTNTSAQIRTRISYSDGNVTLYIATSGWFDRRGRDD